MEGVAEETGITPAVDLTVKADAMPQTVLSHSQSMVSPRQVKIQHSSALWTDEAQRSDISLRTLPLPGRRLSSLRPG